MRTLGGDYVCNLAKNSAKTLSDGHHTFTELYEQRAVLFCALCNQLPEISWKSKKHFDETTDPMFTGDFIAGINTPTGVASYHIKLKYWDLFKIPELKHAPRYDGYTSKEVLARILSLID